MADRARPEEALTFDDVLLEPGYSEVLPTQVDVRGRLTRQIELRTPLLSAAMDTVTEADTAVCMARFGGIGIVHKNLSPEHQAREIRQVKKAQSGMVADPLTIGPDAPLREALSLMHSNGFSGLPVVQGARLVGIVTSRDVRFETNLDRRVTDVMTKEPITVPEGISLDDARRLLHKHRIEKLLVTGRSGELVGLITVKDILKAESHPEASLDDKGRLRVGAAVGTGPDTMERVAALVQQDVDVIVVDTAHGHSSTPADGLPQTARRPANPQQSALQCDCSFGRGYRAVHCHRCGTCPAWLFDTVDGIPRPAQRVRADRGFW